MIIVSGTKRSGTSMWMQVLGAAGLNVLGKDFPAVWGDSIRAANPNGFFESELRNGIYYRTNPDPRTGRFYRPKASASTVVKVFIPGLVRTDMAYLNRVLICTRGWRAYVRSLNRLYTIEDEWMLNNPEEWRTGEERQAEAASKRPALPPAIEWWYDQYEAVRDISVRKYPYKFVSYEETLDDPASMLDRVFDFVAGPNRKALDFDAALAAIAPPPSSVEPEPTPPEVTPEMEVVFDLYAERVRSPRGLDKDLLARMNELHRGIIERYDPPSRERVVR